MEILKRGIPPKEKEHYFTCKNCTSEIMAKQGEVSWNSDYRNGGFYSIKCPVCKESIYKNE